MIPRSLSEQNADMEQIVDSILARSSAVLNCCLPGIVSSFDASTQTASIQPTIRKRIRTPEGVTEIPYPLLVDVPVLMLGGGSHFITMPVKAGDECIVLFSDLCIDAWFQSGGVQNQIIARSHDLSDGFAIVGFRSKPHALSNVDTVYPAVSDIVIAGKRFEEWIEEAGGGGGMVASFDDENETIVIENREE